MSLLTFFEVLRTNHTIRSKMPSILSNSVIMNNEKNGNRLPSLFHTEIIVDKQAVNNNNNKALLVASLVLMLIFFFLFVFFFPYNTNESISVQAERNWLICGLHQEVQFVKEEKTGEPRCLSRKCSQQKIYNTYIFLVIILLLAGKPSQAFGRGEGWNFRLCPFCGMKILMDTKLFPSVESEPMAWVHIAQHTKTPRATRSF